MQLRAVLEICALPELAICLFVLMLLKDAQQRLHVFLLSQTRDTALVLRPRKLVFWEG